MFLQNFDEQLECLEKVISWLVLTRLETVTIFDQKGLLEKHVEKIAKNLKKEKKTYRI